MCSRILGPAMAPSLVTWPTRNTLHPLVFARRISIEADSLTWDTLPGALAISGRYMVCMESTTITAGGDNMQVTISDTAGLPTLEELLDLEITGSAMGEDGQMKETM